MEFKKNKNTRCTKIQIQLLQKYMANNKTISMNITKSAASNTLEASRRAREWIALRALLRKHGPDKSVEKWKQTWRDLKRKFRKEKSEVQTKKCDSIISDSDTFEPSTVYEDPLKSIGETGTLVKDEHSMSPMEMELPIVNLDIPRSSPMQVVLTTAEPFTSTSAASTQTSNNMLPSMSTYENSSASSAHCCHQNILSDVISRSSSLQIQQNALLQKLCNLLEEQNSNLRIHNRIERNKMRFKHSRRF